MSKPKKVDIAEAFVKYVPYNFVFVLSSDKKGKPNGMIAAWHTKCSHEPPIMAVCLFNSQNTYKLIKQSREFILAVPNKKLLSAVKYFGSVHGHEINKFKDTKIKTFKINGFKTPLLTEATINYACKLIKAIPIGDHTMFIGRVKEAYINEGEKVLVTFGKKNGQRIFKEL